MRSGSSAPARSVVHRDAGVHNADGYRYVIAPMLDGQPPQGFKVDGGLNVVPNQPTMGLREIAGNDPANPATRLVLARPGHAAGRGDRKWPPAPRSSRSGAPTSPASSRPPPTSTRCRCPCRGASRATPGTRTATAPWPAALRTRSGSPSTASSAPSVCSVRIPPRSSRSSSCPPSTWAMALAPRRSPTTR